MRTVLPTDWLLLHHQPWMRALSERKCFGFAQKSYVDPGLIGVEANSIRLVVRLMTLFFGFTITTVEAVFFFITVFESECDCKSTLGSTLDDNDADDVADTVAEDDENGGKIDGGGMVFSVDSGDLRSKGKGLGPDRGGKVLMGVVAVEEARLSRHEIRRCCRHGVSDIVFRSLES